MKRITIIILVVSMIVLSFAAAINASSEEVPTYKLGIDAAYPPWTWAEKGEVKGFEIELFEYIGELKGFKIEFVDIPWSTIISALSKGKIDMLVGGLSFSCKRAQIIDFTLPYRKTVYPPVVRSDSDLNIVTALSMGHTLGAQAGSNQYRWCKEELVDKGVDVKLVGYETVELGIKEIESGRIDAFISSATTARGFIKAGRKIKMVGLIDLVAYGAFGVTPGDPHKLLPKINDGIKKAYESGKWAELVAKYPDVAAEIPVGEPVPYPIDYAKYCEEQGEPL